MSSVNTTPATLIAGAVGVVCGAAVASLFLSPQSKNHVELSEKELASVTGSDAVSSIGSEHPSASNPAYNSCIYLDCNATTPIYPEVADKMWPYANEFFGNPSSGHVYGGPCKHSLQESRDAVAKLINAQSSICIVFTACGTESDNRAIDIALDIYRYKHHLPINNASISSSAPHAVLNNDSKHLPRVVTSAIEHPAILSYLKDLRAQGEIALDVVDVDSTGLIKISDVLSVLNEQTALVTIMHSNNEIGTIQPIEEICTAVKRFRSDIIVHTDAAQSIGKTKVDVQALSVDLLTLVGHKYGAPKGIAALYIKQGVTVHRAILVGGGQEGGIRAGTENMLHIVALGEASRIADRELSSIIKHYIKLRIKLIRQLLAVDEKLRTDEKYSEPYVRFNGPPECYDLAVLKKCSQSDTEAERLAGIGLLNTVSVSIRGQSGHALVAALGEKQVACSAGSACFKAPSDGGGCSTGAIMSHVLSACKVPEEFGLGTLRLSAGRHTTEDDMELAALLIFLKLSEAPNKPL